MNDITGYVYPTPAWSPYLVGALCPTDMPEQLQAYCKQMEHTRQG